MQGGRRKKRPSESRSILGELGGRRGYIFFRLCFAAFFFLPFFFCSSLSLSLYLLSFYIFFSLFFVFVFLFSCSFAFSFFFLSFSVQFDLLFSFFSYLTLDRPNFCFKQNKLGERKINNYKPIGTN